MAAIEIQAKHNTFCFYIIEGPSGYIFGKPTTLTAGKITFYLDGVVSTFYMVGFLKDDTVSTSGSIINGAGLKLSDFGEVRNSPICRIYQLV
jgi:hypothetical protein